MAQNSARHSPKKASETGLALVSVLWVVALLSLIAASMLSTSALSYRMERNALARAEAESIVEAGIALAILSLLDPRADRRWRVDGVAQDIAFADTRIKVSIQDEFGRIDLNQTDGSVLSRLFQSAGLSVADADGLAARVLDWRSSEDFRSINGADAADYRAAGLPYGPRNGPFQSVQELNLVLGMTRELYDRVAQALTVHSQQPGVDARLAPREALLAAPGMEPRQVDGVLAARLSSPGTLTAQGLTLGAGILDPAISLAGHPFAIMAEATHRGVTIRKEVVIRLTGDDQRAYMILSWR